MALYLGGTSQKINIDGKTYRLNIPTKVVITEGALLLSSNNYILQDLNGIYLTVKTEGDK